MFQANACVDFLVHSFNELFNPVIETGEDRIREPHDIDELTRYYRRDEYGNMVPNFEAFAPLPSPPSPSPIEEHKPNFFDGLMHNFQTLGGSILQKRSDPLRNEEIVGPHAKMQHPHKPTGTIDVNDLLKFGATEIPPQKIAEVRDPHKSVCQNHLHQHGENYFSRTRPLFDFFSKIMNLFR